MLQYIKSTRHLLKKYFKLFVVFLFLWILSIVIFFIGVHHEIRNNAEKHIIANVQRQRTHFLSILETHFEYLEGLASYAAAQPSLICEENLALIEDVAESSSFELLALMGAKGSIYYSSGTRASVTDRAYYQSAMQGSRVLSDPLETRSDGGTRVILCVPVTQNGEITGAIGGSYNLGELGELLFSDLYNGTGSLSIVNSSGDILLCRHILSGTDSSPHTLSSCYGNAEFVSGFSLEEMMQDFAQGNTKLAGFSDSKDSCYVYYEPMGYNEWMICYTVPVSSAYASYHFIFYYEILLVIALVAEFVLFLVVMFRTSLREQRSLLKYAWMDALTGISNKISTEESIEQWLQNSLCTGPQSFLMLDIDQFKKINDVYGHAVGDSVLREIGNILRLEFRDSDVVGRLGGDEFCILMKNARPESVARKCESLCAAIRNLRIAEAEGLRVTCSIGVSFFPQHGRGFISLYKCADEALYQTKASGRDGYTLYHRDTAPSGSPATPENDTRSIFGRIRERQSTEEA